MIIFRTQC